MGIFLVSEFEEDRQQVLIEKATEYECTINDILVMAQPGSFFCHEAITLLLFMSQNFYEVSEHVTLISNPSWYIKAKQISDMMYELYYEISNEHAKGDSY